MGVPPDFPLQPAKHGFQKRKKTRRPFRPRRGTTSEARPAGSGNLGGSAGCFWQSKLGKPRMEIFPLAFSAWRRRRPSFPQLQAALDNPNNHNGSRPISALSRPQSEAPPSAPKGFAPHGRCGASFHPQSLRGAETPKCQLPMLKYKCVHVCVRADPIPNMWEKTCLTMILRMSWGHGLAMGLVFAKVSRVAAISWTPSLSTN